MRAVKTTLVIVLVIASAILMSTAASADEFKLNLSGATYTKWLWGNMRYDGSMYNFTTVPGEGYGDNGQGSELELFVDAKVSKKVSVHARIHSRFNQNEWTNMGGWGGSNPPNTPCVGGNCGEFDSRSNQYIKLRGVAVTFTPGYKWLDTAVVGANDWGMFDPYVIGRIRYIDRDNVSGLLFQGSMNHREFTWDFARISLPRLWAGPFYNTGVYKAADASYGMQFKYTPSGMFDVGGIFNYVNDQEVDAKDTNFDNGLNLKTRFRNSVVGVKFGVHPDAVFDIRGAYYHSTVASNPLGLSGTGPCMGNNCEVPTSFGINGYSPVITGKHQGSSWKLDVDVNDPFGVGLSFNAQAFFIGANYASMMAARRESDVLLTEGHDSAFAFPGPTNASYGVFGGNRTRIGYGGWDGNAVQVATINVDNEFTDFDEPMAETAIGWKGITITPTYTSGALQLAGEYTHLGYDTNWQAWDNPKRSITDTDYPATELDTGVGHNFRSAYAPFQDKKTDILVFKGKYVLNMGRGVDVFWKAKWISEDDNRMNEAKYLPYVAGDCSYTGPCNNVANNYYPGLSTSSYFGNPNWITVTNPVTGAVASGYQWKPFDSLADDNRKLNYYTLQLGAGYQLTNDLYGSIEYHYYHANLKDGNTAFQAYNLHEMASGHHEKNYVIVKAKLPIGGADIGFEYQYVFGTFKPDFGTGYVVQYADAGTASNVGVPVNSPGFAGRYGNWNSLLTRNFDQQRIKAYMKIQF